MWLYIFFSAHKSYDKKELPFHKWISICITFSSHADRCELKFYIDGNLESQGYHNLFLWQTSLLFIDSLENMTEMTGLHRDGVWVFGVDQDKIGGWFDGTQAFSGQVRILYNIMFACNLL